MKQNDNENQDAQKLDHAWVWVWQPSFVVPAFLHGLLQEHWMKHVNADDDLMLVHRRRTAQKYNDCWNDFKTIRHYREFCNDGGDDQAGRDAVKDR